MADETLVSSVALGVLEDTQSQKVATAISQVAIAPSIEAEALVKLTQFTVAPVIVTEAKVLLSQITLAIVYPSDQIPPDDYIEPYPCTVCVRRVPTEMSCVAKSPAEVACVRRVPFESICIARAC